MRSILLLSAFFLTAQAAAADQAGEDILQPVRAFVLESVKAGHTSTLLPPPMNRVRIKSGNIDGVLVESDSGEITLAFKQLKNNELLSMAQGLLQDNDLEGMLSVMRLANFMGVIDSMEKMIERTELKFPTSISRIERVRSELFGAPKTAPAAPAEKPIPKTGTTPATPATPATPPPPVFGKGINQEGRKLPPLPPFTTPILFNTPEADAIVAAMQIFPPNNPWNEDISKLPVHSDSTAIIANIGAGKKIGFNSDMCYVLVPPQQPKIDVKLISYPGESDKGPYPVPDNAPIEGWPMEGGALDSIQRNGDGDRHMLVVDPYAALLYEFYTGRKTDSGWVAACEATFDLRSNATRPKGWTSSDAAGLPIFPSIVRFDECERGMVEHALRFTVRRTRNAFIWPATHMASRRNDATLPAMGQRLRLKADVNIDKFPKHAKAIALALKKYGMFVADNGSDWLISIAPDKRIQGLDSLRGLKGGDFEVIQTTGESEGPRAGGAAP